jgi:hypothetical protein
MNLPSPSSHPLIRFMKPLPLPILLPALLLAVSVGCGRSSQSEPPAASTPSSRQEQPGQLDQARDRAAEAVSNAIGTATNAAHTTLLQVREQAGLVLTQAQDQAQALVTNVQQRAQSLNLDPNAVSALATNVLTTVTNTAQGAQNTLNRLFTPRSSNPP